MVKKAVIVGAGFTGLAAALELLERGMEVTVLEAGKEPGGLAGGFAKSGWKWPVESFYHHVFTNDKEAFALAKKLGVKLMVKSVATDAWKDGDKERLDTPMSLLKYSRMSVWGRIRMGAGLAILKLSPMWSYRWYERTTIVKGLPLLVGREGYEKVWLPLMEAKFGKFVDKVNLAWFWARVKKRTKSLAYPEGGFVNLAKKMVKEIEKRGGKVKYGVRVDMDSLDKLGAEVVLSTVAYQKVPYLWGQTLVLELKRSLMDSYWLNILEKDWPFLVAVEQDKLVGKDKYGGKAVLYLGNYLNDEDKRLKMNEKQLLDLFLPYIKKINPEFAKSWIVSATKQQAQYAQPVFGIGYGKKVPKVGTKIDGVWIANMAMVYPWDRGINYALEMGRNVAKQMLR